MVKPAAPAPAVAYSYMRFSSPAQAEGDSVDRQTRLREGWLRRHPHVTLDTSLKLVDAGVSGFRGANRTNRRHALAQFLDLVERGKVAKGSVLLCENLDRVTRENPVESIPAVLGLIRAGIRVVQLAPIEMTYDADMDQSVLMFMLMELGRGHAESKRKAGLLSEVWNQKKRAAREGGKPHGHAVPAWLELRGGAYRVREDKARAVRLVFRWSAEGLGSFGIVRRLRAEGVSPIGKTGRWSRAYVNKLLNNPAVLGTYQPHTGRPRVPDGDPVENYFPAVVTEAAWHAAHAAIADRARKTGRPVRGTANPFAGLLRYAGTGAGVHVITRRGGKGKILRSLVAADAIDGGDPAATWCQFPFPVFVDALLGGLAELRAADLFADPRGGRVAELRDKAADLDRRLAAATARFEADPESTHWQGLVTRYDRERRAVGAELAEERRKAATPAAATWAEAVRLMARDEPDRLRAALLATVEAVLCLFVRNGSYQLAVVQVVFREGGAVRSYLILHRPWGKVDGERWAVESFAGHAGPGAFDLRDPGQVANMAKVLAAAGL